MVVTNSGVGTGAGEVYLSVFDSAGNLILDRGAVSVTGGVAERYASISELSDGNCVITIQNMKIVDMSFMLKF